MQGSLESKVLSKNQVPAEGKMREELELSYFLNRQIRREDFEQVDQTYVVQGEIAHLVYSAEKEALFIFLWWLVKQEDEEDGYNWLDFGRFKEMLTMMVHVPPSSLKIAIKAFKTHGTVTIRDAKSPEIEFTFFSTKHEENLCPEWIPGLEFLTCTM